ncbi:hypothetical protein [Parabacteroides distasonis]|uniref:hypothetical protein n=1 Tax=Parabacteroides distasonis TaxID=823 RepID=UPI000F0091B0|nr:hypothetical protein [Parabacteroides distasonis]RHM51582.1 hypothetical protein DWZ58_19500 [Parabacteroides distasonis]
MPTENTYQSIPSLRKIEIEYLAWQITRMQAGIREFIGQKEAHLRFGRQNVERWVSEGRLQRYKRPGKIEYRLENLYKCALYPYDY